jgi:hypothetical protein
MKLRVLLPSVHSLRIARWAFVLSVLLAASPALADDSKLSENERQQIIRDFLAERPFVHRALPRGKAGVRIEGEKITPSEAELSLAVAQSGAAAKPGERVRITGVRFERHGVLFEINGGPMKRKSWRERVNVGVNGVDPRSSSTNQPDPNVYNESTGSSVFLDLKDGAKLTTGQIKDLLAPVLDFKAMTVAEAYQKTLPPKLAEAVKNHHALVGMDKEMVLYALGRPPRRVRETSDGKEVEEWIYGAPPQDVEFIRFISDKAVSIEEMKVSGEKLVRTQDEVGDLGSLNASSEKHTRPDAAASDEEQRSAPSLLRPGEKQETPNAAARDRNPNPIPDGGAPPDPGSGPTQNPAGRMPTGNDPTNGPN